MRQISIPIGSIATLFLLTSCAGVGPLPTGSGAPEVSINSNDTKRIKELLVAYYATTGHTIVQDTQYTLTASKPLEGSAAALVQIGLGNAYSSAPTIVISHTIVPLGGATKVTGHVSVAMQGAFGQNQGTNLDHGKAGREVQRNLEGLKQHVEKR